MRIAISPDENPGDPGTTADPTITERDLNVRVAGALQEALQRCGQDAWFDPSITFVDRVQRANSDRTDLLVAVAHNAGGGQGMRALFCPGGHQTDVPTWSDGRPNRQDDLAAAVGAELEAAQLVDWWSPEDEAVFECCQFQFDTGYLELEFMDSPHDQAIYRQPGYPAAAAEAVTRAVAHVYGFTYVAPAVPQPEPPPEPTPPAPPSTTVGELDVARAMVLSLYATVLGRMPESDQVITDHANAALQRGLEAMVHDIVESKEGAAKLAERAKLARLAGLLG